MPIETQTTEQAAVEEHRRRVEQAVEQLNSRIARLAIALSLDLTDKHCIDQVLKNPTGDASCIAPLADHLHSSQQRRTTLETAELRGLLVLRYGIEQKLSQEMGYAGLQDLLLRVEHHMKREGFAHGADGLDLNDTPTP